MVDRQFYLQDIPMEEARGRFVEALSEAGLWGRLGSELIPLHESPDRMTAAPVWAAISAPHYHASAMDGYAVRARDTIGATESNPLTLTVIEADADLERVERPARAVNTGHPMPPWANAVIMIEHVHEAGPGELIIRAPAPPWKHVRQMGEDMVATELVLPANHLIRPVDLGALAGSGHSRVEVVRKPRVAILPTGSELVGAEEAAAKKLALGQIIEYNSLVLGAQIEAWGGEAVRLPIAADEFEAIKAAVEATAPDCDLLLINAGSSAGSEDYSFHVIEALGEVLVHGIAIRPGHPVIFGMLDIDTRRIPVIGVPGYPVSAALTGEIFIQPIIRKWLGQPPARAEVIPGEISRKVVSPPGDDDYVRVTVGKVGPRTIVTPLSRGAGVISSLVRADGLVHIPRFSEGLPAGALVDVQLYRKPEEIDRTIVAMGSHDLILDLLAQYVAERAPGSRLVSANVGSLGGLVALKRGEAHLAGSHLLDPETGEYNWRYIDQYIPGREVSLITLAHREQGLITALGNSKGITGLADLARADLSYINRQRGAGTRALLDYELGKLSIAPETINGYEREEYTHLAVAAAIAGGTADCGLGIRAAARALELDFVTVGWERYDLVIPREHTESDLLQPLLELLNDPEFRAAVAAMPGYDVKEMGYIQER